MATTPEADKNGHPVGDGHASGVSEASDSEQLSEHGVRPAGTSQATSGRTPQNSERPAAAPASSIGPQVRAWLSHPLLLLIFGGIMTGIIVPSVTGQWQRNQTAQQMKTQLITDVTNAVSAPMAQMAVSENPVFAQSRPSATTIASTYSTFMNSRSTVASELSAYFSWKNIPAQWDSVSALVNHFYLLTYAPNRAVRQRNIAPIQQYFQAHHINASVAWPVLLSGNVSAPNYYTSWLMVKGEIEGAMNNLNTTIMDAPSPSF